MADTPLNATFYAFKKRERGGVLLGASIAYAVLSCVLSGAFFALNWGAMQDYMSWVMSLGQLDASSAAYPQNPLVTLPPSVIQLWSSYSLMMIVSYLLFAAYEAACLKWMIHGETSGIFGLSLGADTWRVYFGYWLWYFLLFAVYFVCAMVIAGVTFAVMFGAGAGAGGGEANPALMVLPLMLGMLLMLAVMLFFAVRFGPAAATSIARRRFSFFDAWTVTKGRFWPLLGAYLLLILIYGVVVTGLGVIASVVVGASIFGQIQSGGEPQSIEQVFALIASPSVWIPLAAIYAVAIVAVFWLLLGLFGVNARAAALALEEGRIQAVT